MKEACFPEKCSTWPYFSLLPWACGCAMRASFLEPIDLGWREIHRGGRGLGSQRPMCVSQALLSPVTSWRASEGLNVWSLARSFCQVWPESGSQRGSVCGAKVEIKSCFRGDLCPPFRQLLPPLWASLPSNSPPRSFCSR